MTAPGAEEQLSGERAGGGLGLASSAECDLPQGPERHRVAQRRHRRDAVFPVGPGRAVEEVGRAWREIEMAALPPIRRPPPEAQAAGRAEGDADDLVVLRTVPMPADAGSGLVLGDQGWTIAAAGTPAKAAARSRKGSRKAGRGAASSRRARLKS